MLEKYPHAHTTLAMALDELTAPPAIVVLRGPAEDLDTWRGELDKYFDPRRFVAAIPSDLQDLPPGLASKTARDGTVAYLCRGMTCSAPLATLAALVRELRGGATQQ
jgi:hypothetical protein